MKKLIFIIFLTISTFVFSTENYSKEDIKIEKLKYKNYIQNISPFGISEFEKNNNKEGMLLLSADVAGYIGLGMNLYFFLSTKPGEDRGYFKKVNGKNYFYYDEALYTSDKKALLYGGLVLTLYSTLIKIYFKYEKHKEYLEINGFNGYTDKMLSKKENLKDLMLAPYKPKNFLSKEVLGFYPLTLLMTLSGGNNKRIGEYFERDKVNLFGKNYKPIHSFGIMLLSAMALTNLNATWEEIESRGIDLENSGIFKSSLSFGLMHLPNALSPNTAIENTIYQTLFATSFGTYAAYITKKNNYSIEKAVAIHFWHNVTVFVLGHMAYPDKSNMFQIKYTLDF